MSPFESLMSPKVEMSFVGNLAESFARGQPYASRIGLTLFRNQVRDILKNIHSHSVKKWRLTSHNARILSRIYPVPSSGH
jgi:hypothetical protein